MSNGQLLSDSAAHRKTENVRLHPSEMIQEPKHVCSDHMQIIARRGLVAESGSSSIEGEHREMLGELIDKYLWPGVPVQSISGDQSKRRPLPDDLVSNT